MPNAPVPPAAGTVTEPSPLLPSNPVPASGFDAFVLLPKHAPMVPRTSIASGADLDETTSMSSPSRAY